jgi:twinkle protein
VKGQVTFLGGIGNHGKSSILKQLLLIQAVKEDACVAWFGPEEFPAQDFYNDLIHMYVGKSTEPYHSNQMDYSEYEDAMEFLKSRFYYIYPESNSPTPDYINNRMAALVEKYGVNFCVTDPFNQLDNDWGKYGRDDQYIGQYLSKEKRFAQDYGIHKFIVGHPKGSGIGKSDGVNYDVPQVLDYAGGAMWNNKCDNIICYHRPNAISDPTDPECFFISQKIKKRKITGVPGRVLLTFDVMTNRFLENGISPLVDDFEKFDTTIQFKD